MGWLMTMTSRFEMSIPEYLRGAELERKAKQQAHAQARQDNPTAESIEITRLNRRLVAVVKFPDGASRTYTPQLGKDK